MAYNNGRVLPNGFSILQNAIMLVLADGMSHKRQQLLDALPESEYRSKEAFNQIMHAIRKKLGRKGETVVCEWRDGLYYRHVRLLAPAE